jgi:plasmid stability protein
MSRSGSSLFLALVLLSPLACGGAAGSAVARSGADEAASKEGESIGELASQQGGLAALGGAGNREEGGTEIAFTGPLRAETLSKKSPPRLDGVLKEWHARSPAKETLAGETDGLGLDVAVQTGDDTLWLAAEIVDANLTRTGSHGAKEDHVTLTIAFPSGRGALKAYEIGLWPGTPGSAPGAVKWTAGPLAGQKVAGAKLVENDVKGGVTLEATIPWSAFAEAATVRVGMRAAFRYHDGDGSSVRGVLGTGGGSVEHPGDLPALPIAAEQAVVDGLLEQKGLGGTRPKMDVYADVAGDDHKERVSVWGRFFTICGPGYRKGHQFFWREVAGDIVSIVPSPATGRGKDDLVVRRRVAQGGTTHDVLEVWSFPSGEEPVTVFAHEVSIGTSDGKRRVTNAARISAKEIEVSVEPAVGWDASSFHEALADGAEPLLLPWGTVRSRTYKLEGGRFAKASEIAQAGAAAPAKATGEAAPSARQEPPTPPVQKGSNLGRRVLEAYLKDAGIPAGTKPRFDLAVNVDGDAKPERVALFGKDIVVLGPAFKDGTGYARLSLTQFADERDVAELTVRDLDGNGGAEILVRGTRHARSPAGEVVDIDGLFVYQVKGGNIGRVFAIETGREMNKKRVQGLVQFVPAKGGKGFDVDVRPGMAKGWTKETYPWPQEKPGGAIEPLLLPWGGVSNLRYSWTGSAFTPAP